MFGSIEHRFGNSQDNFKRLVYKAKQEKYKIALSEIPEEDTQLMIPIVQQNEVHKEIWELYDFESKDIFNKHNPNKMCNTEYNIDKVDSEKELKKLKSAMAFLDITKKSVKNKYEKKN
jgi:hypothetical protein